MTATATTTAPAVDVDSFDYAGTGRRIAEATYGAKNTFTACREAFVASEAGASHEEIAKATAKALTAMAGETRSFSRQAVDQRVVAFGVVASRLASPVPAIVAKAYTLASKPTATAEIAIIADSFVPTGVDKADAASLLALIETGIASANKARREAAKARNAGDETTDEESAEGTEVVESVFVTAAEVVAFIAAQGTRTWSDEDRDMILDAMATFAATTA